MKHTLLILMTVLFTVCGYSQDTIRVKTLTFDDITKRSGTYLFPPAQRYERIWLEYTLKCDVRTAQDRFPCGEWDYLTYTVLTDSTGEFDSTLRMSPNFRVRGSTPAEFGYVLGKPLAGKFVRYKKNVTRTDSMNVSRYTVGNGMLEESVLLNGSPARTQFVWTKDELVTAGVKPGKITGLRFSANSGARNSAVNLALRMRHGVTTSVTSDTTLTTVYNRTTPLENGMIDLHFHAPFNWNGTDGITIDFSVDRTASSATMRASAHSLNSIGIGVVDHALLFTNGDRGTLPQAVGNSITNEVTVAFWCYGDGSKLPRNSNIFEATNADGRRVLNSHLPWSNSRVYWDAGVNAQSGAYDRIEMDAPKTAYADRWNHWAFVKNSTTGIMRIYLNGSTFLVGTGKTNPMSGITKFVWGSGGAASFEGLIDDFGVWNRVLDSASIARLMTSSPVQGADPNEMGLQCYYSVTSDSVLFAVDGSVNGRNSELFGLPTMVQTPGAEMRVGGTKLTVRPDVVFEQGTFTQSSDSTGYAINVPPKLYSVELFPTVVERRVYQPSDPNYPDRAIDTLLAYEANIYLYTIDEYGRKLDSALIAPYQTLTRSMREWFSPVVDFEIGRYITPYGIGLDLGPKGFKWIIDMTDYAPLLRGNVTLSAGNQQELIDMTFVMIKGTPPRDVVQIDQLWYDRNAQFPAVIAGTSLPPVTVDLNPMAKDFMVRSVTSGHDFSNETNCAEFCIREHFISVNDTERFKWELWKECGDNPVYPQGGTWLIDRAGWCPAAPVDIYDFNLTPFIAGPTVTLDYGIKKKALNENWGRWEVASQLFGYSAPNHVNDVAVTDVMRPTNWEFYQRINPVCGQPLIIIRNTGSAPLTSCVLSYGVVGGEMSTYNYNGNLKFMEFDTVTVPSPQWPTTEGTHAFVVTADRPNGKTDEYIANNSQTTQFGVPKLLFNDVQIQLRTNNQAGIQYEWTLRKTDGTVIDSGQDLENNKLYTHDYVLEDGCYEYELINKEGYGLDFWFLRAQLGTGSLVINSGGQTAITFDPDFGNRAWTQFRVGEKPTVKATSDTMLFNTPTPARITRTVGITSANNAKVAIDSVNVFSTRPHFSLVGSTKPWPFTLGPYDTVYIEVAFDRPDAGASSGSLRIYSNDARNPVRSVKLLGNSGATSVDWEATVPLSDVLTASVNPNPVTSVSTLQVNMMSDLVLEKVEIKIVDVTGSEVSPSITTTISPGTNSFPIDESLAHGSYNVVIRSGNTIISVPFVKIR